MFNQENTEKYLAFLKELDVKKFREALYCIPHCCPVCTGKGFVANGFYNSYPGCGSVSNSLDPETCRTCGGSGVLWSGQTTDDGNRG